MTWSWRKLCWASSTADGVGGGPQMVTDRYYDKRELLQHVIRHHKIICEGWGETWWDSTERREQESCKLVDKKHNEETQALKKTNSQQQIHTLLLSFHHHHTLEQWDLQPGPRPVGGGEKEEDIWPLPLSPPSTRLRLKVSLLQPRSNPAHTTHYTLGTYYIPWINQDVFVCRNVCLLN